MEDYPAGTVARASTIQRRNEDRNMAKGKVVWFSNAKGFGFLSNDDGGPEIFVHYSGIASDDYKTLKQDQPVEFEIVKGKKGPQAENVRVIGA